MGIPFQVGIDIVSVRRMREIIRREGSRFLNRIFTDSEQAYCNRKRDKFESYAARFAAKEAVLKAQKGGRGRYAFRDIEVVRNARGAPSISVKSEARKKLGISLAAKFELTLAHEREFAIAAVILFDSMRAK